MPDWENTRAYSIVVAPSEGQTCGLFNAQTDLFLTTKNADGSVCQDYSILDRQLVPSYTRDRKPDRSITYSRVACSAMADPNVRLSCGVLEGEGGCLCGPCLCFTSCLLPPTHPRAHPMLSSPCLLPPAHPSTPPT